MKNFTFFREKTDFYQKNLTFIGKTLCFLENLTFFRGKTDFYRKNLTFIGKASRFLENLTFISEKPDVYRKNSTFTGDKLTFFLCFAKMIFPFVIQTNSLRQPVAEKY